MNNAERRCQKVCDALSYASTVSTSTTNGRFCEPDPHSCDTDYFGDDSTNMCVNRKF